MVDHRQPLARTVEPVLAERRAIAVDVVEETQAVAGDAVIGDGEPDILAGRRSRGSGRCSRLSRCSIGTARPSDVTLVTVIPLPSGVGGGQVEDRFSRPGRDDAKRDGRLAVNLVRVARQKRQTNGIVTGVDARLSRVGVGTEA